VANAPNSLSSKRALLQHFCEFLTTIGLRVTYAELVEQTFLPGVCIRNGELVVDERRLLHPGDLLHEAAHIAVSVAEERTNLSGNVVEGNRAKAGDELAVMLWTYAACSELRIAPEIVFHSSGYKGDSSWLLECFARGQYIGLPLLVWMGLAHSNDHPHGYPKMIRWLR